MNPWHKVTKNPKSLPPEHKQVLIHLSRTSCINSHDPEGAHYETAILEKGISMETRNAMKRGELPDPLTSWGSRRSNIECGEDEIGNNKRPYIWRARGHSVWGQDVDYWMYIPKIIN